MHTAPSVQGLAPVVQHDSPFVPQVGVITHRSSTQVESARQ